MRRQAINFAPPSWRRLLDETHPLALCLAVIGVALCVAAGSQAERTLSRIDSVQDEINLAERDLDMRSRQKRVPADFGVSEPQAAAVNAAIRQLNLPWRDVLDAVEAGTPAAIELLSLEPDARRSVIKIEAESKNADDMLGAVEQLKQQPFLTGVFLVKHTTDEADPRRALRFQIEAAWRSGRP